MPTDMTAQPTFSQFALLPAHVRRDIWGRAAQEILATPSVRVLNITRRNIKSYYREDVIANRAWRRVVDAAAPDVSREVERNAELALQRACREYRTAFVAVAPRQHAKSLATYSASRTFSDVAGTSSEARDITLRLLKLMGRRRGNDILSLLDPSKDIVCLRGPETASANGFPFFSYAYFARNKLQRQVVFVANPNYMWFTWWNQWDENREAACSPSLLDICPALAPLRRVAFAYQPSIAATAWNHGKDFLEWLGLDALWPYNLPKLEEIYLVAGRLSPDHSLMTSRKHLLTSIPSFAGSSVPFTC
jgi:hypothetical protein